MTKNTKPLSGVTLIGWLLVLTGAAVLVLTAADWRAWTAWGIATIGVILVASWWDDRRPKHATTVFTSLDEARTYRPDKIDRVMDRLNKENK